MAFRAIVICTEDCSADYTVQNILLIVLFPTPPNSAIFALMQINRGEISEDKKNFLRSIFICGFSVNIGISYILSAPRPVAQFSQKLLFDA